MDGTWNLCQFEPKCFVSKIRPGPLTCFHMQGEKENKIFLCQLLIRALSVKFCIIIFFPKGEHYYHKQNLVRIILKKIEEHKILLQTASISNCQIMKMLKKQISYSCYLEHLHA